MRCGRGMIAGRMSGYRQLPWNRIQVAGNPKAANREDRRGLRWRCSSKRGLRGREIMTGRCLVALDWEGVHGRTAVQDE